VSRRRSDATHERRRALHWLNKLHALNVRANSYSAFFYFRRLSSYESIVRAARLRYDAAASRYVERKKHDLGDVIGREEERTSAADTDPTGESD
jgi:hypothetical protein